MSSAPIDLLKACFSSSGRINRAKYWLGLVIASCLTLFGLLSVGLAPWPLLIAVVVVATILFWATIAKRLHDLNISGRWAFGFLVAAIFANKLRDTNVAAGVSVLYCAALTWLGAAKGSAGQNRFGPETIHLKSEQNPPSETGRDQSTPFYLNKTRDERQHWFASTRPWDRLSPSVIDAILDGITDKVLLEAFVVASTTEGLMSKYELLGREKVAPTVIRAQLSQILSETGMRAIVSLEKALETKQMDAAGNAAALTANLFEPAIALAKDQVAAYIGMAHLCRLAGKRDECHDWAKRGLAELDEMRPYKSAMQRSTVLPADLFDQEEKYLRTLLEY